MAASSKQAASVGIDNPIRNPADDVLGRAKVALSFAEHVLSLDVAEGVVVGVLGAWGSGKTSFINLARSHFQDTGVVILDFNPWMFSGAEQLVESFFVELAAQLQLRPGLSEIGKELENYGEIFSGMSWVPLVGPWIERGQAATKFVAKVLQRKKAGLGGRRAKVEMALRALDKPLVIVLDDIDRLTTVEIRDIFKLVRLTASFANVVYILAFDRARVEEALSEDGIPGRDYLEKILQISVDLPAIPAPVLDQEILRMLDTALDGVEQSTPFDRNVWPDVFLKIVRPLLRNMRDVRRYAAAVQGAAKGTEGQVALVDILALEAVRVFLPDVFQQLNRSVQALTTTSSQVAGIRDPAYLKAEIDRLIEAAGDRAEIVRAMIHQLFPAAQRHIGGSHYGSDWKHRWLRERRIAHEEIFRLYLERVVGHGLRAFADAEEAWARMADREGFDECLRSIEPDRRQDVIASLEAYKEHFSSEHVIPGSVVLLNLLPELPDRERAMLELSAGVVVGRMVYGLLRPLGEAGAIEVAVREILPQLASLSAKAQLIDIVGHRERLGCKLVSESGARGFEKELRDQVRLASAEALAEERDLSHLLLASRRDAGPGEPMVQVPDSPRVTLALLRSARADIRSQAVGSHAVRKSPRLAWDGLIELYGGEDVLRQRLAALKCAQPDGVTELLELADQYLAGWRPDEFPNDLA